MEAYTAATPRLLPFGVTAGAAGPWSFAQWYKSREHRALLAAPLTLAALELWRACPDGGRRQPFVSSSPIERRADGAVVA